MTYREIYQNIREKTNNFTDLHGAYDVSSKNDLTVAFDILNKVYSEVKKVGLNYSNKTEDGLNYEIIFSDPIQQLSESLEKATPYMLRNDGKLLKCELKYGDYHPYILNVYDTDSDIKSLVLDRFSELKWFYDNTNNNHVKEYISIIYNSLTGDNYFGDSDYIAKDDELKQFVITLNNEVNNEFCRVRTSNIKYGGHNNDIYFRISSIGFNWFPLIWDLIANNKEISNVTITRDNDARNYNQGDCYRINGKEINHMPRDEFLTLKGNPIMEKYKFKQSIMNKALQSLEEGKSITESLLNYHPRYMNDYYKYLVENQLKNDMNIKLGEELMRQKNEGLTPRDREVLSTEVRKTTSNEELKDVVMQVLPADKRLGYKLMRIFNSEDDFDDRREEIADFLFKRKYTLDLENDLDEAIEKHDQLNPDLWDENNELKPEVKEKLEEIVAHFDKALKEDGVELDVMDICIIGSNASYNYNPTSDIDLHIVANTGVYDNEDLALKIYQAYKSLFNNKYMPTIRGHEVEIYVEPYEIRANSKGIYSLKDGWLKEPENTEIPDINQSDVDAELQPYIDRFDDIIIDGTVEDINSLIDDIYLERQSSILKDGEFAIPNLMFKEFRANGYLQKLRDRKVELENKAMSINDSVNPDLIEMFLNDKPLSEELIEYNNGGVEFRFPEIEDTLAVYLQWEGIYGFDQLILDNKDLFEDDLEELLSYEGVIGYAGKIKKILEGEACFCWDMEMSDFRNICNQLDLNPEEAELFDGETVTESLSEDKIDETKRVNPSKDDLNILVKALSDIGFEIEEVSQDDAKYLVWIKYEGNHHNRDDFRNVSIKLDDCLYDLREQKGLVCRRKLEHLIYEDDSIVGWVKLKENESLTRATEDCNKKEEDYNLNIVNLRDGKETIETVDTVVDGDLAVKLDKDIDGLWAEKDFDIILDEDKKFTRDDIKDFVLIALPGDRKGSKKDLSIEKVSTRPSDIMITTWGVSGEHQVERYIGNVVATSNDREELLNIAKDLIKKNKEIYRLHYATMIDYLYRFNGRPATEKEKKQFEKELYEFAAEDELERVNEAKEKKIYTVVIDGPRRSRTTSGTLEELIDYFGYTLEKGYSWQHERGNHKINRNPKTIDSLIDNLNWASDNAAANGYSDTVYYLDEDLNNKDKEDEKENNDYLSKEEKEILKGLPRLKFDGDLDESANKNLIIKKTYKNNKGDTLYITQHSNDDILCVVEEPSGVQKRMFIDKSELDGYIEFFLAMGGGELIEKIVKKGSKYQVQSEKGRNMGTYDTKEEAEERLKEVEMFKHMNESYVVYTDDYFEDGERSYVADIGDGLTSNGATDKTEAKVFNTEKEAQDWIDKINNEYDSNPDLKRFTYSIEKLNKDFDLTKAPSDLSSKEYEDWYRYAMNNLEEWQKENGYGDFILPDVPDTPLYDNRFKTDLRKHVPGYKGKSNREIINKLKKLSFEERQELKDTYRKDYLKRESKEEKQMKVLKEDYNDTRARALADYLGVDVEDIDVYGYDDIFAYGKDEYYVLDYDEAVDKAKEFVKNIIDDLGVSGAFTERFLDHIKRFCADDPGKVDEFIEQEIEYYKNEEPDADQVEYLENLDSFGRQEYIINLLGEEEFLNEFLNLDEVASEAVDEDGPAHFISTYDGEEIDLNQNGLYAYRIN